MERLPDRLEMQWESTSLKQSDTKEEFKSKKEKFRDNLNMYLPLLVIAVLLFFLTAGEPVHIDDLEVTDIRIIGTEVSNSGIYVAGELKEDGAKFSKCDISFEENTGIVRVMVNQYQVPTFFGTKQFAAQIDEKPEDVKEIWLVYDDSQGDIDQIQLDYSAVNAK